MVAAASQGVMSPGMIEDPEQIRGRQEEKSSKNVYPWEPNLDFAFVLSSRTMHVTTMIQACRGTVSHVKRNRFDGFGQSD